MTNCSRCKTFQQRLRRGKLCNSCFELQNQTMNNLGAPRNPLISTNSNSFPGLGRPPFQMNGMSGFPSMTAHMTMNDQAAQTFSAPISMPTAMSTFPHVSTAMNSSHVVEEEVPQVNSIQELYVMLSAQMNNLGNRMSALENLMTNRLSVAENRLKLHDDELARKDEQIAHLTNTMINMQRSLNSIDSEKRSRNLIVSGLTEGQLTIEDETVESDLGKINLVLSALGLPQDQLEDNTGLSRIGKENDSGRPRLLQVVCNSNEVREKIIKASPKLKDTGNDLSKIFINRDSHPVYQKENGRLRKRLSDIKRTEREKGNECDAKIVKGKLIWNGSTIDQNLFFH